MLHTITKILKFISVMVQDQIIRRLQNLSQQEIEEGINLMSNRLIKIGKVSTPTQGRNYIDETLTILLDPVQREIFKENYTEDNKDMVCRWSVWSFLKTMDNKKKYEASGMKAAVHNARAAFTSTPGNSKTILS